MFETLLLDTTSLSDTLFNFTTNEGIEGNTWHSQGHSGEPLFGTQIAGDITLNEYGVEFNAIANRRLKLNRPIDGFINTVVTELYALPSAKGRVGIMIGNYNNTPSKNVELHENFKFRVYGDPGDAIGSPVPAGRLIKIGYTTDAIRKCYRVYKDGQMVEELPFSYKLPKVGYNSIHYIGGDTRTSYILQGSIRSLVGYRTTKNDQLMRLLTSP